MNIAVLSDIHSNSQALGACIKVIDEFEFRQERKIDHIFLLGDYVTDGPYPERTMDMIYDLMNRYPCTAICGNREEYLLSERKKIQETGSTSWAKTSGKGLLLYTYEHTRECDWRFFESLPNHRTVSLPGTEPITIAHGSQFDSRDNYHLNPSRGDAFLEASKTRLLIGGHSHLQHTIERNGKTYINAGSVGKAQNGIGGQAQFIVLTYDDIEGREPEKRFGVQYYSVPYDIAEYCADYEKSGILQYSRWLSEMSMLYSKTGINYYVKSVQEVEKRTGGSAMEASEEIWEQVCVNYPSPKGNGLVTAQS